MPTRDYICPWCHKRFELTDKQARASAACPDCGTDAEKQPCAPSFTIKGYNARNGYSKTR